VRLTTNLRTIRVAAALTLTEVEDTTGISRGTLSQIETGRRLPADKDIAQLELVYGDPSTWYDPRLLLLIQNDLADESGGE
jgi:transcriptional regulator with XRE-family HTH domain